MVNEIDVLAKGFLCVRFCLHLKASRDAYESIGFKMFGVLRLWDMAVTTQLCNVFWVGSLYVWLLWLDENVCDLVLMMGLLNSGSTIACNGASI